MNTIYPLLEHNATAEYISDEIIHVKFNSGGLLSTQLLRELKIIAKIRTGKCINAIILSINDNISIDDFLSSVYRKAERCAPDLRIAIVSNSLSSKIESFGFFKKNYNQSKFKTFSELLSAFNWCCDRDQMKIIRFDINDKALKYSR
ncbi:MAG: hypothetical protein JNJ99_14335 [Crocinitomicaceae bacterium]|nr:hypothetical protein [Crocinitomicaceae bacterium]